MQALKFHRIGTMTYEVRRGDIILGTVYRMRGSEWAARRFNLGAVEEGFNSRAAAARYLRFEWETDQPKCGWCGKLDAECERCPECGNHGCVINGECIVCGARSIGRCEWFALCDNQAIAHRPHPVLGNVPICERCNTRAELDGNTEGATR